mgnify:CR=1 FL=1
MVVVFFLISAIRTSKVIEEQIKASKDDREYLAINESRRAAMSNMWLLLSFFMFVSLETLAYNILLYTTDDDNCQSTIMSDAWHDALKFLDRSIDYQSWFIPLIWLYWPTKAHKRENRSRKRAIDRLFKST